MFKRILFVIDLSSRTDMAKRMAIHLAKKGSRQLNALIVVDPRQAPFLLHDLALLALLWRGGGKLGDELKEKIEQKMWARVEQEAQAIVAAGIQVEKRVRLGRPAEEVVKTARELKSDLIVMGAPSRWSIFDVGLESTAVGVVRDPPCSVLIVSHLPPEGKWSKG